MARPWKTITSNPIIRVALLSALLSGVACFVMWDHHRVNRDFRQLKALLTDVRYQTAGKDKNLVARFTVYLLQTQEQLWNFISRTNVKFDITDGDFPKFHLLLDHLAHIFSPNLCEFITRCVIDEAINGQSLGLYSISQKLCKGECGH
jgi:hypothetical protein